MSDSGKSQLNNDHIRRFFLNDLSLKEKIILLQEVSQNQKELGIYNKIRDELFTANDGLFESECTIIDAFLMGSATSEEKVYVDLRNSIDLEFKSFFKERQSFIENIQEGFLRRDISAQIARGKARIVRFKIIQRAVAASLILGIGVWSLYFLGDDESDSSFISSNNSRSEERLGSLPQNAGDDSSILGHTLDSLQVIHLANLLVAEYEGTYSREKGWGRVSDSLWVDLNAALDLNGLAFSPFFIRYVDEIIIDNRYREEFSGLLNKEIDSLFSISYTAEEMEPSQQ